MRERLAAPLLSALVALGGCANEDHQSTPVAPSEIKPSLGSARAPAGSGPIVVRFQSTVIGWNFDFVRNLASFQFDVDHPPNLGFAWADGCGGPIAGNIADIQIVTPKSGQWVETFRELQGDLAVYDITGLADPFNDVLTCAFLGDPSRRLAKGTGHFTGKDNDLTSIGPGNETYHFMAEGRLTTPGGNAVQYNEELVAHIRNDGTFTLTLNTIRLTPDPRP
jgi:hypothetical protein